MAARTANGNGLIEIEEIITHPNYNNRTFSSNLSLLILVKSVTFNSYIQSICLRSPKPVSQYYQHSYYAGFAVNASISYKLKSTIQSQETLRCRETLSSYGNFRAALSVPLHPLCGNSNQTTPLLKGSPLMGVNMVEGRPQSYFLIGLLQMMRNQSNSLVFIRVEPHIAWIEQSIQSLINIDQIPFPSIVPARLVRYEKIIDVRTNFDKL